MNDSTDTSCFMDAFENTISSSYVMRYSAELLFPMIEERADDSPKTIGPVFGAA